ncbi:hypothetical protein TIFTF001_040289 [Ficus carica]|uniref:Uncharacterized protein n=1 Tax=Ficus carica TaxID=3494 RepID=A0AA87Z220_FICCA|nr:hypothetical protein TIFTF001_040289 [Ficus carica]
MAWAGAGTRSARAWLRSWPGIRAVLEWSGDGIMGLGWQLIRGPELANVEGTAGAGIWAERWLGLRSEAGMARLGWQLESRPGLDRAGWDHAGLTRMWRRSWAATRVSVSWADELHFVRLFD